MDFDRKNLRVTFWCTCRNSGIRGFTNVARLLVLIAKAVDRVWHKAHLSKLPAYGLPSKLCDWIAGFVNGGRIESFLTAMFRLHRTPSYPLFVRTLLSMK